MQTVGLSRSKKNNCIFKKPIPKKNSYINLRLITVMSNKINK